MSIIFQWILYLAYLAVLGGIVVYLNPEAVPLITF